ncbi:MAG: ABC transporter permease subunit [Rhodovibrionaceae bacterium]
MRWGLLVISPLLLTTILLSGSLFIFLSSSFHEDLGLGLLKEEYSLYNFRQILVYPSYLESFFLTLRLSLYVCIFTLIITWPLSYILSRLPPKLSMLFVGLILASTFISLPIKALGLIILFGTDSFALDVLRSLGLVDQDFRFVGSLFGVGVGYTHLAIGLMVMMMFSVMQAIPKSLEDAARIHGASWGRTIWRVIVPLSLPGTISASLMLFNLLTGAFVSATLLGGGKILTLPVLIQQSIILFNEYGIAAALAAVLLVTVFALNLLSVFAASRLTPTTKVIA